MKTRHIYTAILAALACVLATGCNDRKSYAELLTDENHATNAFLADHRVVPYVSADSVFEVGENAPYYQLDEDGMVFMQVLNNGGPDAVMAQSDQLIYFRFMRYSLYKYVDGELTDGEGNSEDMGNNSSSFRFENFNTQSSYQWGEGLQYPLRYLPLGCEVNLIIKSQKGLYSEISYVVPYLYRVRYFKSQI